MNKNIQIRNVPDSIHRILKSRASLPGMSLSEYLLQELQDLAGRPSVEELRQRLHQEKRTHLITDPATIIREARGPLTNSGD